MGRGNGEQHDVGGYPAASRWRVGRGTVYTHSTEAAAPTGFDDIAPYTVAVVDLEEGGRLLAWIGDTIDSVEIGMVVQVIPRIFEELEDIRVYYTVELPGTTWGKAPRAS